MLVSDRARRQRYWWIALLACLMACGAENVERSQRAGAGGPEAIAPAAEERAPRIVLFLGTSLTAGSGVAQGEAFPARIQERIQAAELPFRVINGGVSGDTSAGGLRRLDWLLRQAVDVLVLELGANDMLRGLDIAAMRENLQEIVDRTREAHPEIRLVVAGMRAAPNMGEAYISGFEASFPALATRNHGSLIPFLLEGVAADPDLNQPDGIHPTPEGHQIVADTVWQVLEPILRDPRREG
ncbi:MAG: arylesterase [Deltaproteobacteria bacterium]|nr:arylesterase [Deltaproteobacteria bacterium]